MAIFSPFSAYFDCSGSAAKNHSTPVLMVSGAVSTLAKWLKFEREWLSILDEHSLENPFHMAEFMDEWGARPDERDQILRKLAKVIRTRTRKTFSSGVVLADWRMVNQQYQLAERLFFPFPLCATIALRRLDLWKKRNQIAEPIERVFEDGDHHRDEFIQLLGRLSGPIPIFKAKTALVPLQLGDCIAWQNAKTIGRVKSGKIQYAEEVPEVFRELLRQENKDWGIFDADSLVKFCEQNGVPKRN